ncbi:unnamed protein product, partial [Rotaria sp. Silwood1]
ATDTNTEIIEIDVAQPAIVLLEPGQSEGALGRQPLTYEDECEATFWQQRAIIYRMGPNEFFHKPRDDQHNLDN